MVGPLSHRYKQQKWQRLAFCVLAGMRLTAFKSTHSDKPTLAIFLSGYTAIYAERDSGMAHVVKLTHPHQETHVVAADTEEQALSWAEVRILGSWERCCLHRCDVMFPIKGLCFAKSPLPNRTALVLNCWFLTRRCCKIKFFDRTLSYRKFSSDCQVVIEFFFSFGVDFF